MKLNSLLRQGKKDMFLGLPVGRGCVSNCSYCGGGSRAQRHINRRRGVIFRRPEKVAETIEELRRYGFRGCYLSFDPRPLSQPYYLDLFRLLRRRKLGFGFHFSAWNLLSREFLDEFARLPREDSAYLISPESGSERVRRVVRGHTYTNSELLENLKHADRLGIRTVVYFSLGGSIGTGRTWRRPWLSRRRSAGRSAAPGWKPSWLRPSPALPGISIRKNTGSICSAAPWRTSSESTRRHPTVP